MSTSKKPLRKRKRQSPPPPSTASKLHRRLDKIRTGQRNLWQDDNDEEENDDDHYVQPKATTSNKTYIVLSDSEEEKPTSQKRSRTNKPRKKPSQARNESCPSDNDYESTSKCATCLICSILSTLTSYNCCSKHLSVLKNEKHSPHRRQKMTTHAEPYPAQHVMILPMTDELIQRYLNPQGAHYLRTEVPPTTKKLSGSQKPTRKLSKKATTTSEPSDAELVIQQKASVKLSHVEPDQSSSSSLTHEGILSNSEASFTIITSTSTTTSSFKSPNMLDTCQLQQSSDQPIMIDDSQPGSSATTSTGQNKPNNPWTPVSDETYAAIEVALSQSDQTSEELTEFTPATARRTATDVMASRLPKIQLNKGRFRQGKPVEDKATPDTTTTDCGSSTTSQSSSVSRTTSLAGASSRPPPVLATIVEDESLITPPTQHQVEKSSQTSRILSQRHENGSDGLSDTLMSCLFAQDESSQHENGSLMARVTSDQARPPPTIVVEDYSRANEKNRSDDISQSSQLSNDQNDTQPLIPSGTNEKTTTTPARVSYRTNPDGSRVSISRPPLSTTHSSPATSIRRTSIDVTSSTSHPNR